MILSCLGACSDGSNPKINANMNDKMCKNGVDNKVEQVLKLIYFKVVISNNFVSQNINFIFLRFFKTSDSMEKM